MCDLKKDRIVKILGAELTQLLSWRELRSIRKICCAVLDSASSEGISQRIKTLEENCIHYHSGLFYMTTIPVCKILVVLMEEISCEDLKSALRVFFNEVYYYDPAYPESKLGKFVSIEEILMDYSDERMAY